MPYKLYNLQYKSLNGEMMSPSRYGIKFEREVKKDDYITYNGLLLLVTDVKGLLLMADEINKKIYIGRD